MEVDAENHMDTFLRKQVKIGTHGNFLHLTLKERSEDRTREEGNIPNISWARPLDIHEHWNDNDSMNKDNSKLKCLRNKTTGNIAGRFVSY